MTHDPYTAVDYTVSIAVDEYMARFRDGARFLALCSECPCYGAVWGCPPFDFDPVAVMSRYSCADLFATKIVPAVSGLPLSRAHDFISTERRRVERRLLSLERECGGRAFIGAGRCSHCGGDVCARSCGRPCRHPEMVRPSLEAVGFDIGRTVSELFGMELQWGKDGLMPQYLTLVTALFHN